ncbi:MAG TPA: hydantoinase/oxoprolinase family protein [Tepidisphaeraceae bacterium]|nr:hydantoinase/oxoprolinase family protein [Tepidisphaeraceae bacterium]
MSGFAGEQTNGPSQRKTLHIGVDVGGTFTDLVAFDGETLRVVKIPSTPPAFDRAVVEAVRRATAMFGDASQDVQIVHGSTVATNALLQRAGEPVAFITTEGFRDMLLIGRQNRPKLYALRIERPPPITPAENWFTVRERIDAKGNVITPLEDAAIDQLVREIHHRHLKHAAVCLLFSFVNADHERRIGAALEAAGITVSLSSDVLPEFREYERASTTAINASLRPTVEKYLRDLQDGLLAQHPHLARREHTPGCAANVAPLPLREESGAKSQVDPACVHAGLNGAFDASTPSLRIMHSGGGTLSVADASRYAAKLVLSGPAGGVIGAAFVAHAAGFDDVITYDMGGTSTDVALVLNGEPQWSTGGVVDGLPIGLPAFDIHTVGAGGGSIAHLDTGGALRVGPKSAGAVPGPACYARGGTLPTVTDANLCLGRILPDRFLGGGMTIEPSLATGAIEPLAKSMNKSVIEAALGIVKVAEANMASAIRAVTSQRGHDPRNFSLVSFGGAGGLHACALADALEIPRVIIPPYCGVLSALGMVVAKPIADASKTVVQIAGQMDDTRLKIEFEALDAIARQQMPDDAMARTERFADARFRGQSYEVKVPVETMSIAAIAERFKSAYNALYGMLPQGREIELVTLRVRRVGHGVNVALPPITRSATVEPRDVSIITPDGVRTIAKAYTRTALRQSTTTGPMLLIDPTATAYIPAGWRAKTQSTGVVLLNHRPG